jgi:LacI family transcriptional regulator
MITTRDIARAAGVNQSTVSRSLRDDPIVALSTRRRVQKLASTMGYKPNPLVSALMSAQRSAKAVSQRQVLAYLTSDLKRRAWESTPTYVDFYAGAAERAASYGFDLEEFWLHEPRMTAHRMSQILYHRNIRGVLIAPLRSDSLGAQAGKGHVSLDWPYFSTATLGHTMMRPRIHRATPNHFFSIRVVLRQLRKLGYRRPGLALHAVHDARVDHIWSTVFSDYLLSQKPSLRTVPFIRDYDHFIPKEFVRWYKQQGPDVVVAGSWRTYGWMKNAGIEIPRDCGFILLDLLHKESLPNFAGIDQNGRAVAAAAIDLIVGQLHRNERGLPDLPKTVLIDGYWVDGDTVREVARL